MKFAVYVRKADSGFGASSPDVPNVFSTGPTVEVALARFREGLVALFELIREEGGAFPTPETIAATVEIEEVA